MLFGVVILRKKILWRGTSTPLVKNEKFQPYVGKVAEQALATNAADIEEFFNNIPANSKFLYSAFNKYNNIDIINFLNNQGVATKVERGKRVFQKMY